MNRYNRFVFVVCISPSDSFFAQYYKIQQPFKIKKISIYIYTYLHVVFLINIIAFVILVQIILNYYLLLFYNLQ